MMLWPDCNHKLSGKKIGKPEIHEVIEQKNIGCSDLHSPVM